MAIAPTCDKCGNELTDFGGILLSPPDAESMVIKYHLCKSCFEVIAQSLQPRKQSNT